MIDNNVSFRSADWRYIEEQLNKLIKNQRDVLENRDTTFRDSLVARGSILAYKTILHMPELISPAKGTKQ